MKIFASTACSADGCLDDCSSKRLVLSSPEDWAEVHRLRSLHDAIMVGAETLRRDNCSLVLREPALRAARMARGEEPDIVKVTLTASGRLDPALRFFTEGNGRKLLFTLPGTSLALPASAAEVIRVERLTAAAIVTELEKRGIRSLFIEGGPRTLEMFFAAGMVDRFREAVNPSVTVNDPCAPRLRIDPHWRTAPHATVRFGDTVVTTYQLRPDTAEEDERLLRMAVEVSRRCRPSATSYCVGAVIVTPDGRRFTGYTHETSPTHHAEQEAIAKAVAAGTDLRGATIYSSMEPCSSRKSEPRSCSELILDHGFARVVFALYEPDCFVACRGALNLRERGVDVRCLPQAAGEVLAINSHLFK